MAGSLIVVVPGIGGSVLARPGRPGPVWDASKSAVAGLAFRPGHLALEEPLELRGLTESTTFLGFTLAPGYEILLTQLAQFGQVDWLGDPRRPVPGAAVVAAPYDFRQGLLAAAEQLDRVVCAHLSGLSQRERAGRVTVVAHSMGGLVARVWMGLLGRWPWCRSLVTLGTPHRGAPKALQWLVNGVPLLSGTTEMLRGWPSVYELLPRYRAVFDPGQGRGVYPYELDVPWLTGPARAAYDLHRQIQTSWEAMSVRPEVVPCIGWNHPTLDAGWWERGRLRMTKQRRDWVAADGWEHDYGDGTVPAFCALPTELSGHTHGVERLEEKHLRLSHYPKIATWILQQRGHLPPSEAEGPDAVRPPALGLDVEEVHAAGEPIPIGVWAREITPDLDGRRVLARLRPARKDGPWGPRLELAWDPATAGFAGVLPGQAPGLYDVRVEAREVPGAGTLQVLDTVAVTAP